MSRLECGDVFYASHPDRNDPHWFVVVTDRALHDFFLAAMITDSANFVPPPVRISRHTTISRSFRLVKESTIDIEVAYFLDWNTADEMLASGLLKNHDRERNPDLIVIARDVFDATSEWDDEILEYVEEIDWNRADSS